MHAASDHLHGSPSTHMRRKPETTTHLRSVRVCACVWWEGGCKKGRENCASTTKGDRNIEFIIFYKIVDIFPIWRFNDISSTPEVRKLEPMAKSACPPTVFVNKVLWKHHHVHHLHIAHGCIHFTTAKLSS